MTKRPAVAALAERDNRGLLLDLLVLFVNLAGMAVLSDAFRGVVRRAAGDDPAAMTALFGYSLALFLLAPIGATLKRWHFHRGREGRPAPDALGGCLFNPIVYFCLVVVVFAAVNAFIMQRVFGNREPGGAVFVPAMVLGLALIITHTVLVYRYFSPPRQPPRSAFMRGPVSEVLGDAALFTNMLLFQLIWNALSFTGIGAPSGLAELLGRLLVFAFLALLLYFPPRMFYLADDIRRPLTWLTMVLANAPAVWRLVFGSG